MDFCEHVYQDLEEDICRYCGKDTHRMNWDFIKEERRKHREKVGILHVVREWWSI